MSQQQPRHLNSSHQSITSELKNNIKRFKNEQKKRYSPIKVFRDSSHHVADICSEFSPSPLTSLTRGSSRVAEVAGAEDSSVSGDFPPKMRLFVKDWVAQWDPLYSAWFYYHPQTGQI